MQLLSNLLQAKETSWHQKKKLVKNLVKGSQRKPTSIYHFQVFLIHFLAILKCYRRALFCYRKLKYTEKKISFIIYWKIYIRLLSCFMGRWIWMMVTCSSNFRKFWCTLFENSTFITYNHFLFFSRFMHPLAKIVFWEVHKDDLNMLRKFQVNPVYCLKDMHKTILSQETILKCYRKVLIATW